MEHTARLPFLFDKYLAKDITVPELDEMLLLMQQAQADAVLTPAMLRVWERLKGDNTEYPVDWNEMYHRISEADNVPVHRLKNNRVRGLVYKAAAAILIVAAGAGVFYWSGSRLPDSKPIISVVQPSKPQDAAKKFQTIHLPDGSTVILNINSKLDFQAAFSGSYREVTLTGEGFFDIKKDAGRPFLVHTGNITTKVLGTSFNIKAYPADEVVKVTVASGRVQLLEGKKSIGLLTVNEQLVFSKETGDYKKRAVDAGTATTWKPGDMVFDDITLAEAAARMQDRFGIEITFVNEGLKACRITAQFSENDTLEEMLTVLCGVSKATYTIQNNKITIYGKGCK